MSKSRLLLHQTDQPRLFSTRRMFLADVGMGLTGLALGSLLAEDGISRGSEGYLPPDGDPHFAPKAKSVIWVFLLGGLSHVESFDPKPALNRFGGMSIEESPHANVLQSPLIEQNLREFVAGDTRMQSRLYPMQIGHGRRGQSGLEMSDWFPHLGSRADDLALVRSMWTTDNDHAAQLQVHTGRHVFEGQFPTIGAWVHYGLGSLNDNLPQFVVLGGAIAPCCGGIGGHGANYLGPEHAGVMLKVDPNEPLPFTRPSQPIPPHRQQAEFELIRDLNRLVEIEYPDDPELRARVKSYELAFEMQTAIPEVVSLTNESAKVQDLYGLDTPETESFGRQCLVARRMVEQGVRFVQIFHGADGAAGEWDAHSGLKPNHERLCRQVDKPLAGLIADLKQRGLLDETIVVIATEFGRTPGVEGGDGRDHHPFGFSVAMAGGGIRGGVAHGATDELGFHAVEDRHYVTDIHATVLHQLGLDPRKLEIPGRKRLEMDFGRPIEAVL